LCITFRLYLTLPAPYKAMRSIAGAGNAGEGAVGMFRPKVCAQRNDLAVAEAEPPAGGVRPAKRVCA
jgi:hypothetical protein